MTATAKINHTDMMECDRHNGIVTRLVTLARVVDLTSTDPRILDEALTAVGLTAGSTLTGYPSNLTLVDQSVKLIERNKVVDVTNTYEVKTQQLTSPTSGLVIASITSTLNQASTNKDHNEELVTLSYTFPTITDTDNPDIALSEKGPYEVAPTMTLLVPQSTVRFKGPMTISNPWLLKRRILGKVNDNAWLGGSAREWLCTVFEAEAQVGVSTTTYEVTLEFQHAGNRTWDQDVIMNHPVTGEPLADAVDGVGRKTVQIYKAVSFEAALGVRLLGG